MKPKLRYGAVALILALAAIVAGCNDETQFGPQDEPVAPGGFGNTAQAATPERVLILGSSTTACAGQLPGPVPSPDCYVSLVRAANPQDEVTAVGRGGTYIAFYDPKDKRPAAQQNWATYPIPTGYDRVIVQLGINDWYVPVAPATLRQHIDKLMARVRAANPNARIAWLRAWMPTPTGDANARQSMWMLHGQYTADAMAFAHADLLDMGTTPYVRRSTVANDGGWHYNVRGHAELAQTVNDWLAS